MTGLLTLRATVDDSVADQFGRWYEEEHIPDAMRAFRGVTRVTRWKSLTEDRVFTTAYEFDTDQHVLESLNGDAIKPLIGEFDRLWNGTVTRTRSGHVLLFST